MNGKPLVSIVMPSFNQAQYLEAALKSVLEQDYSNIEYLIADGSSTDGSAEIIQRYADRFAWWEIYPDKSQSDAMNKSLTHARGDLLG